MWMASNATQVRPTSAIHGSEIQLSAADSSGARLRLQVVTGTATNSTTIATVIPINHRRGNRDRHTNRHHT